MKRIQENYLWLYQKEQPVQKGLQVKWQRISSDGETDKVARQGQQRDQGNGRGMIAPA